MKPIAKQSNKEAAFTIVELLTVMSIIIILMGLLAPAMNRVRRFARRVNQKNQFHSIDVALELFRAEFEGYPDSGAQDPSGATYPGAMKLAEAMVGQDLLGFHPDSRFLASGMDGFGNQLYYCTPPPAPPQPNVKARKEHYLPLENANAYKLSDIYGNTGPFSQIQDRVVLCDVYTRATNRSTGKRIGMPILYFKANESGTTHNILNPDDPQNIYDYKDNQMLVELGKPWNQASSHTLFNDPAKFYEGTWNEKVSAIARPYRADSFILMSAGFDGEYGTLDDDVFNFEKD